MVITIAWEIRTSYIGHHRDEFGSRGLKREHT